MKKLSILFVIGIISCWVLKVSAQSREVFPENFDGNITWTVSPASAWKIDANYYISPNNSIRGVVPNQTGDEITLTSPIYDFTNHNTVLLRFSHICKVSPQDITRIEYKLQGMTWQTVPATAYMGKLPSYNGFNANTYPEWQALDSLAMPDQSWWKEEIFNIGPEVKNNPEVQFRFVLKHGSVLGSQISYGWLIDNIEVVAATDEIILPVVELLAPLVKDIVYSTGPWEINAKVKSQTTAPIETPWLVYTAKNNQGIIKDSLLMTMIAGDSLWKATIPQFVIGTEVLYTVTGKDTNGNTAYAFSNYIITKPAHSYGNNSASLRAIVSPIAGQTIGNTTTPVEVMLRNKGDINLTSATIYWSLNGVTQTSYPWTGNLSWDMEQQVTIGNYQPRSDTYDKIVVWVSNPNNTTDPVLSDDTLEVTTYGCFTNMTGSYTIGQGELDDMLNLLSLCSPTGDITLALKSGVYDENWNFTDIKDWIGNHTLTITSLANHRDSVILRPSSGVGIELNNTHNITVKHITIDVQSSAAYEGIEFTGANTNVVIDNCNILSLSGSLIYKDYNASLINMRITNCTIQGGNYGIYLDDYCQNITIDSNIITGQYYYGILLYYVNLNSISYNQISPNENGYSWRGLYLSDVNGGNIIGNRIFYDNPLSELNLYGMYVEYSADLLIANNEIYLNVSGSNPYWSPIGLFISELNSVKFIHNSVLVTGGAVPVALDVDYSTNNNNTYKNNLFIAQGYDPYSIRYGAPFTQTNYIDYNNYYSSGSNLCYIRPNQLRDLAAWKAIVSTDTHSVSMLPDFIDLTKGLELSSYASLYCNVDSDVSTDIEGLNRKTPTVMGCYENYLPYADGALVDILVRKEALVSGTTDSIQVIFVNGSSSPLNSVSLGWSMNGTSQTPKAVSFSAPLLSGQSDTISLEVMYPAGDVDIKIWINNLEGGTLVDGYLLNDTVSISVTVCANAVTGVISVSDASTLTSALQSILACGVGDITLELATGEYAVNCDLSNINNYNNSLTITSQTGKPEDVIIKPASGAAITLSNTRNLVIKAITVDVSAIVANAIQFAGTCTNIVIRDCRLMGNPSTSSSSSRVVYANGVMIDSLFFINNLVNGGYSGVDLKGGTGTGADQYGTNIVFDSNIISNQYYYGMNLSYIDMISCSSNTLSGRTSGSTTEEWTALRLYYCNGPVIGNKIIERNSNITDAIGINLNYYNFYPATQVQGRGLIANNEIILTELEGNWIDCGGMFIANSKAEIIHNSIHLTGSSYYFGIYITNSANNDLVIRNNNIVANNSGIYFTNGNNLNKYDIDYNNIYASTIGRFGSNITTIEQWRQIFPTDSHSVSLAPNFIDVSRSLELNSYDFLYCDLIPSVPTDIKGNNRKTVTTMGCYQEVLLAANGSLTKILDLEKTKVSGVTDSLKVIFVNKGTTNLSSVNLGWSINGTSQTPASITFATPLSGGEIDTVTVSAISYPSGNVNLKVWINSFEGGTLLDEFPADDTVSGAVSVCATAVTGTINVSNVAELTAALQDILTCGVGDITLVLATGEYAVNCNLSNINRYMPENKLTITSQTGKASDVKIKPASGVGITLAHTRNLVLKNITVDASLGTSHTIHFTNSCTNILVRECILLADSTSTASPTRAVVYKHGSGIVDSIFFIKNQLDGGTLGFYFQSGSSITPGTNLVFDSNTVTNQYQSAIQFDYSDFISCSHNTILSRTGANLYTSWKGIYISASHGPVIGNRIIQRSNAITEATGIFSEVHNRNNANKALIANNEIILNLINPTTYNFAGIYTSSNSRTDIINNSIYVSGSGAAKGIVATYYSSDGIRVIKNNNIVLTSTASNVYPVHLTSLTGVITGFDIDYNNYYAPTNIGYYGVDITTMSAWQQSIPSDQHSVKVFPNFINASVNLELASYSSLACPLYPSVTNDIKGATRPARTAMGAYNGTGDYPYLFDLEITQIISHDTVVYPQTASVKVEILNAGHQNNISSATFGWSIDGELQSPYSWTATSNPLTPEESREITIGTLATDRRTATFDIVVWIESVNGSGLDAIRRNDTATGTVQVLYDGNNLSIHSIELVPEGELCPQDYVPFKVNVENTATSDYDFAVNPATFSIQVNNPEPFSFSTVISTGEIKSGERVTLILTDTFPIVVAGVYDIEVFFNNSVDNIKYDDTLRTNYTSKKFGLPIDVDFSSGISAAFTSQGLNTAHTWEVVRQGTGADAGVQPVFGDSILAFVGSPGSMTTLSTQRLDLSRTQQPSLSFWYFHDTVPCEDYTEVRITVDGGATYNTLYSLTKYDAAYGWRQYSMDLPPYAVNQCVILVFEAMEKSRSGNVTQYIDRIRITAKRDIELAEILTLGVPACDMENKEWKLVLSNHTDPVLDYSVTPVTVTLEITGTSNIFTKTLNSGALAGFSSDTVTLSPTFNFAKGTYPIKAWFTSVLDDTPLNDTLETSIVINPDLSVQLIKISAPNACLAEKSQVWQEVILTNTGSVDLSDIEMVLQIDTGDIVIATYTTLTETYMGTIQAMGKDTYRFVTPYIVPWNASYSVRVTANLGCNITLSNNVDQITECVDTKDLEIVSIDNPLSSSAADNAGSSVQVIATVGNRSDLYPFNSGVSITVWVRNSQGVQTDRFTETTGAIGTLSTISHTFTQSYTVPEDTVYYLTVYIESNDIYPDNDTIRIKRTTDYTGINTIGSNVFALSQNIPNPATNSTRIDYSVPEAGEVMFHIHSISGQLLYSQTIDTKRGTNSIELNTTTFAVGVYFYSMEYKGQRLVKQLIIK